MMDPLKEILQLLLYKSGVCYALEQFHFSGWKVGCQ